MSALPLSVYIDCPLKDIRNNNREAVKSVHLLAVAANITDGNKQILVHVIPALSSPFTVRLLQKGSARLCYVKKCCLTFPWSIY